MIVYTVSVIDVISDPILGIRRTPAIYTDLQSAIYCVVNNENNLSDDGLYQYAVIEETLLNVIRPYIPRGEKLWYKFNTVLNEFIPCSFDKIPNNINKLYGFGIG